MTGQRYTGRCLCGAVTLKIDGPLTNPHACHCGQCRRQAGNFVVGAGAPLEAFTITGAESVTWFESSPGVRRGFCAICGSNLFWDDGDGGLSISLGCLDQPTGLKLDKHIFVDDKADYTDIVDELPKFAGYDTPLGDRQA